MALKPRKSAETRRDEIRRDLLRTVITEPLLSEIREDAKRKRKRPTEFDVIIVLNEFYAGGRDEARSAVYKLLGSQVPEAAKRETHGYVFATVSGKKVLDLVQRDSDPAIQAERKKANGEKTGDYRAIYRVWKDHDVEACIDRSISTVKADAAHRCFNAFGDGICWAIIDSGIEGKHPHFANFQNLKVELPLVHMDFTESAGTPLDWAAMTDPNGHGTHVAGILAGCYEVAEGSEFLVASEVGEIDPNDPNLVTERCGTRKLRKISGMAPRTRVVNMRVLDDRGKGKVHHILRALDRIQQINDFGRRLHIHGVNMSLSYEYDPRWFGCGQSPICVEVDRLVKSGVAVVVAAGNEGYAERLNKAGRSVTETLDISITDPGNADLAITVGSTHRDMPHTYGVSYFSSRGPTGDGRLKPDLLAPGERIVSCAAGKIRDKFLARIEKEPAKGEVLYGEDSGTSMAAPHVSGAIAAFLSVRNEFISKPEKVKEIFLSTATDLKRSRHFQGSGLLDLMRALQSV